MTTGPKLTLGQRLAIVQAYQAGNGMDRIAVMYRCSRRTVAQVLGDAGVPSRPVGRPRKAATLPATARTDAAVLLGHLYDPPGCARPIGEVRADAAPSGSVTSLLAWPGLGTPTAGGDATSTAAGADPRRQMGAHGPGLPFSGAGGPAAPRPDRIPRGPGGGRSPT